ncbi:MAG: glycosyltransferase [Nitrospirae bacterium]|nr:glycosyltransferase [Nitrospirota bacterium]MBI3593471.1 glycosyltransferase [Nitrospirota bacterium]
MKVALVHDYLNQFGGAERVVEILHEMFPDAPIFTSFFIPEDLPSVFTKLDIRESLMRYLPFLKRHFKKYLLLYPKAFESFDLEGYDLILSSSSAFAKGIIIPKNALHICYCYTPMRFVWDYHSYIEKEKIGSTIKMFLPFAIRYLKKWDLASVRNVHHFIAISDHIRKRIRRCYQIESEIIYPPVNTSSFELGDDQESYFLIVSRLNAYKSIDIVIEAFNQLGLPLVIAGGGPQKEALESISKPNITFLGKVSEERLKDLYRKSKAFIFPGEEDFGMAPVESMASGRPVIAFGKGGALETIIDGKTGIFFQEQNSESVIDAVKRFHKISFNSIDIRKHAKAFDSAQFRERMKQFIKNKYDAFQSELKSSSSP